MITDFTPHFTDSKGEPHHIPENLKKAVIRICQSYGLTGLCDPMYIANVIAVELGIGDGQSNFYGKNASHIVKRMGIYKFSGTANECFLYIHRAQGNSVDYALKYGGWTLEPLQVGK